MRIEPTEAETLRAVMHLLAAEQIFALRINTSSQVIKDGEGHQRFLRSHSGGKGVADIFSTPRIDVPSDCSKCHAPLISDELSVLWIEVKSPKGRQSPEQVSFQKQVEEKGHHYLIAKSISDVVSWLEAHR